MPGQRIYYVPPRLVGSVRNWSGMEAPDGKSWLVEHVADLGFDSIWFSPFQATSRVQTHKDGEPKANSLYAIRDYFSFDPEFSATPDPVERDLFTPQQLDDLDRQHMQHFCKKAHEAGLKVFGDLVFNHVAADHPAVLKENKEVADILKDCAARGITVSPVYCGPHIIGLSYKENAGDIVESSYLFKFARNGNFEACNIGGTTGFDTAQINFASPAAKEFFVTGANGEKGYFKQVIDWFVERGFDSFRCDIAYKVAPEWWEEIISYAREQSPGAVFMAETLGGGGEAIENMANINVGKDNAEKKGFDFGMLSTYWWDYETPWMIDTEHPMIQKMSRFGGAGSPDNHDTEGTLAGNMGEKFNNHAKKNEVVGEICVRNYALSALACTASYMQMGYEYCKEKQNSVFKDDTVPQDWNDVSARAGSVLDISARIREINLLKEDLHVENCRVNFKECAQVEGGKMVKIHVEYIDVDTNKKTAEIILLLNKKPENGPVKVSAQDLLSLDSSGLDKKGDTTLVNDVVIYHTPVQPSAPKAAYKARAQKFKP